jgi:hypothetical protein
MIVRPGKEQPGQTPSTVFDPKAEEVFHIAGDMDHGISATTKLDHAKQKVQVRYKDFLLEVDVYELPNTPTKVVLLCPKCRNALQITADRKRIDFDKSELTQFGGRLNIEKFQCAWESAETEGRRVQFGLGLCGWKVAIENNIAKDA